MKKHLIIAYVVITLLLSVCFKLFCSTSDRPYFYNLGLAMAWPIRLVLFQKILPE